MSNLVTATADLSSRRALRSASCQLYKVSRIWSSWKEPSRSQVCLLGTLPSNLQNSQSLRHSKLLKKLLFAAAYDWPLSNTPLVTIGAVEMPHFVFVFCNYIELCNILCHGKITRHYWRYCTVSFCYMHKCELSYMCLGHDINLHPHQVKLYRFGIGKGANVIISK